MKELLDIKKRFKRSDKEMFLEIIGQKLKEFGLDFELKQFGKVIKSINLETKNDNPDYVFIAHYDTGTILPFWFNWLMRIFGINRQLIIMFSIGISVTLLSGLFSRYVPFIDSIVAITLGLSMLSIFIPNKKNLDDNTSGVITLLQIASKLKGNSELNAKLIFVDNEEIGLIGSSAHYKYLKKNNKIGNHCKVFSIDCIGGSGDIPLIIRNGESTYLDLLKEDLMNEFGTCETIKMEMPASDNYSFKALGALNLSFVSKSTLKGGYYIKNIHSSKDDQINMDRISKVSDIIVEMMERKTT